MNKNLNEILRAYLVCALWSSNDVDETPLDSNYDIDDFSPKFIEKSKTDINAFIELAGNMLESWDEGRIGHDFWLTRNGHGAGFWDRPLPFAQELSNLVGFGTKFGPINLFVNDDNLVYGE
jgi:hypothetical protein